jgi:hypothetical protein
MTTGTFICAICTEKFLLRKISVVFADGPSILYPADLLPARKIKKIIPARAADTDIQKV